VAIVTALHRIRLITVTERWSSIDVYLTRCMCEPSIYQEIRTDSRSRTILLLQNKAQKKQSFRDSRTWLHGISHHLQSCTGVCTVTSSWWGRWTGCDKCSVISCQQV